MNVHDLLVFPLKHLVTSFLHADSLFLLFLDKSLEEVTFSFSYQFLSQLGLVVLSTSPFGVTNLDGIFLKLKSFGCFAVYLVLTLKGHASSLSSGLLLSAFVQSFVDHLFHLSISMTHTTTVR